MARMWDSYSSSDDVTSTTKLTPSDAFENRITLPKFVHLMSQLGVDGPEQRTSRGVNLDSFLFERIGEGAQFEVFKHIEFPKVAKRVKRDLLQEEVGSSQRLKDIELEIRALSDERVARHPNIIRLFGWDYDTIFESSGQVQSPGTQYPLPVPVLLVEPALKTLNGFLSAATPWNVRYRICLDVAAGLECLRKCRILHNDLKPENILMVRLDEGSETYVAKLSDFGLAVTATQEGPLFFEDYGKTRAWKPPESIDYRREKHGEFSYDMLFKSESYTYGMVALWTLFSFNSEGHPVPFSRHRDTRNHQILQQLSNPVLQSKNDNSPRKEFWKLIEANHLEEMPQKRQKISRLLFQVDGTEFEGWHFAHEKSCQVLADGLVPGKKPARFNRGWRFYQALQAQLMRLVLPRRLQSFADHPEELLFGLAIRQVVDRSEGYQQNFRTLVNAAALASPPSLRAMGVVMRVNNAISFSKPTIGLPDVRISSAEQRESLERAAQTGSGIALSDLRNMGSNAGQAMLHQFRANGGYNREGILSKVISSQGIIDRINSASQSSELPTMEKWISDIAPGLPEFQTDTRNTFLHLAATFGACDAIVRLVEKHLIPVDQLNAHGETALYKACMAGNHIAAGKLLDMNASPLIFAGGLERTCLHWLFNFEPQHMGDMACRLHSKGLDPDHRVVPFEIIQGHKYYHFEETTHAPFHWPIGTPLHWAAHMDNTAAVDVLLSLGTSVDILDTLDDKYGQTAFSMAMNRASASMVEYLLSKGANPNFRSKQGHTPLNLLAGDYFLPGMFLLPKPMSQWCFHGDFETCLQQTRHCINMSKGEGALLDARGSVESNTPLLDAALTGNSVAIIALLEAGADPSGSRDWSGKLPVHIWLTHDPQRLAYPEGYFKALMMLLAQTADLSLPKESPLHLTLSRSSNSVEDNTSFFQKIEMLLDHQNGIGIDDRDEKGKSLLLVFASGVAFSGFDHMDSLRYLQHLGADIHATDYEGNNFLVYLAHNRAIGDSEFLEMIRFYLDLLPDLSTRAKILNTSKEKKTGLTPFMSACSYGHLECVRYMLKIGVNFNDYDLRGETALDYAINSGNRYRMALLRNYDIYLGRMPGALETVTDDMFDRFDYANMDSYSNMRSELANPSRKVYFALPEIISLLIEVGAQTGKRLGKRKDAPDVKLAESIQLEINGWKMWEREKQPYYELWKQIYQFDDDTEEENAELSWMKKGWTVPAAIRTIEPHHEDTFGNLDATGT